MFYVEKKGLKDKRYKKVIFFDEEIDKCYEFIANNMEKDSVYRIIDTKTQLKSNPISQQTVGE